MTPSQKGLIQKLDDIIARLSELTDLLEASFDDHPQLPLDMVGLQVGKTYVAANGQKVTIIGYHVGNWPWKGKDPYGVTWFNSKGVPHSISPEYRSAWTLVREA
jgi:hypothetical protein